MDDVKVEGVRPSLESSLNDRLGAKWRYQDTVLGVWLRIEARVN